MYEATRKMIAKFLANPNLDWSEADQEMLQGISDYTGTVTDDMELSYDQVVNPGLQPKEEPDEPEGNDQNGEESTEE